MPDALDGDFSRSRAVLVGTWRYTQLDPVPAARHSFRRLRMLLASPLCGGWPSARLKTVENREKPGNLRHDLVTWFSDVTDVALFYYVGHGQYDNDDRLCLSLSDTSPDPLLRTTTSLVFDDVRHAFRVSKAATKIAILDCCFAGLAAGPYGTLAAVRDLPNSSGFCLLMASGEYSTAWFQPATEYARPQTYFTKFLADTIERGIPGQAEGLTLGPIFDKVADELVLDGKPAPRYRASDHAARYAFARNVASPVAASASEPTSSPSRPQISTGAKIAASGALVAVILLVTSFVAYLTSERAAQSPPPACIAGTWELDKFQSNDYNGQQPNNPQFARSGGKVRIAFNTDYTGVVDVNGFSITTNYIPIWAPIVDTFNGRVGFHFGIKSISGESLGEIQFDHESGGITRDSKGAGIAPTARLAATGTFLYGGYFTCKQAADGSSDQLILTDQKGTAKEIFSRVNNPGNLPNVTLPVIT